MTAEELDARLASAARSMEAEAGVHDTMGRAAELAVELIDGCDHAGISVVRRGRTIEVPVATDEEFRKLEELQHTLGEGPCFDALWNTETVISEDLSEDQRWPNWAPRAVAECGAASMLGYQLFSTERTLGSLNIFSKRVRAFDAEAVATGASLAAHVAVALAASQQASHFDSALASRTMIGQAEGILMERFKLTGDEAFAVLRRVSQDSNTRLRDVAIKLVETRQTPG